MPLPKPKPLIIVGAGAFAREVLDVIEEINDDHRMLGCPKFNVLGVLATPEPDMNLFAEYGVAYLGPSAALADQDPETGYVIAIGDGRARKAIDAIGQAAGLRSPALVHPNVSRGRNVAIGPGAIVCSHVSLTNHIHLGRHVHVNLNSTIGHDAVLDDYVTLSPLVAVSGSVLLEEGVTVGTGASIIPGREVGEWSTIGAGAAVVRDVPAGVTAVGVPARVVERV